MPVFTDLTNPVLTLVEAATYAFEANHNELGKSVSRAAAWIATNRENKYLKGHWWDMRPHYPGPLAFQRIDREGR